MTATPHLADLVTSLILALIAAAVLPPVTHALFDNYHRRRRWALVGLFVISLAIALVSLLLGIRWNIAVHYTDASARWSIVQGVTYSAAIALGLFVGLRWAHRPRKDP